MKKWHVLLVGMCVVVMAGGAPKSPNIIYILADDMGYGDVAAINPEGKIPTPHLDRIVKEGMYFTDAHSNSAVCTPTRYGIVTGRYAWRTRLQKGPLNGFSNHLIAPERMTVASLLKEQNYRTACVGKWHIGMDFSWDGKKVDWNGEITNGPNANGFDYFYGISGSLDMPPYVYIENNRFTTDQIHNTPGISGEVYEYHRPGPIAEGFELDQVLPHLTEKAVEYIHDQSDQEQPFFLFLCFPSPHSPIIPSKEFQGQTGMGEYADFVAQTDAMVGRVLSVLDEKGIAGDTLLVYTSDNGCSPSANYPLLEGYGHNPSAWFRGTKADIYEGGHRVPFLVRWPGNVNPGSRSDELICLTDLLATCADLVDVPLPDDAGEDSISFLPALMEQSEGVPTRENIVHHSCFGAFGIRQGSWKLALCPGSGGWSAPLPGCEGEGALPPRQLFNLAVDVGETENQLEAFPEKAVALDALLKNQVSAGRSTPGKPQQNDVPVNIELHLSENK